MLVDKGRGHGQSNGTKKAAPMKPRRCGRGGRCRVAEGQQLPLDAQQEGLQAEEGCLGDDGPRAGDQRGAPRTVVERSKGLVCEDLQEDQWPGDQDAHSTEDLGAAALWLLERSVHLITLISNVFFIVFVNFIPHFNV